MQRRLNIILALGIVYLLCTWALGSSIKDLCAAASKNDVRKCSLSWEVGIVLMFTKNCFHLSLYYCDKLRSFYLSEFHDCSLAYSGRAKPKPIFRLSPLYIVMPTAPLTLLSCLLACFRLTATVFMFHSTSVGYPRSWRWSSLYARPAQTIRL